MLRKILGILFFVLAVIALIGVIVNGSFAKDYGNPAATFGNFVGTLIPIAVYVFSGIFLVRFDRVCKMNYVDGFKARKKQNTKIIVFILLYFIFSLATGLTVVRAAVYAGVDRTLFNVSLFLFSMPYLIPFMVFVVMLSVYTLCYSSCKSKFKLDAKKVEEYLADGGKFTYYTDDGSVLASDKIIFFPTKFCIVPFDMIASVKFYNVIEKDIIFTLTSGKKITLVANKKQFDGVMAAMEANK